HAEPALASRLIAAVARLTGLAAHVASEKDKQLSSLAAHVEQLELVLGQKEEELEESRRMYNAQKRALREALSVAAEAEVAERQVHEAHARTVVAQAVEDELEKLQHDLALLRARYDLEMRARDTELGALRQQLQAANSSRKQAVAAAEAALTEAWQAEVNRATAESHALVTDLELEVSRVRLQMEEQARSGDTVTLAGELAALNQQKVAIQREFEAFKEMATAASRQNREDAARLLEENANIKARLAARAFQDVQGGFKPASKVFTSLTVGPPAVGPGLAPGLSVPADDPAGSWGQRLLALLARLERQRKGLVPALVVGSVVALFLLVAVFRAAAVTRSEHRGGLCFLAHLGINVGKGCGLVRGTTTVAAAASAELGHLLDAAPRVHDVETVEGTSANGVARGAEAGSDGDASDDGGSATPAEDHQQAQSPRRSRWLFT
ncbi:hypothetical protein TSOC_011114, partial [Tetrabaena socialis]